MRATIKAINVIAQQEMAHLPKAIMTPLEAHVWAFGKTDGSTTKYSADTISQVLGQHGEAHPDLVGAAVHAFNAIHSGYSLFGETPYTTADFANSLHLGTLRLYQPDGSFSEVMWNSFVSALPADQDYVSQSQLLTYLAQQTSALPEQTDTGRHASNFIEKHIQINAGSAAWKELFKILACDWIPTSDGADDAESVIATDLLKYFFVNSTLALQFAKANGIPVPKPSAAGTFSRLSSREGHLPTTPPNNDLSGLTS